MKVSNLTNNNGNKVVNQFRIDLNDDVVIFQSYDSKIFSIDYNLKTIMIYENEGYSRTTTKYEKIFLSDTLGNVFADKVFKAIRKKQFKCDFWHLIYV